MDFYSNLETLINNTDDYKIVVLDERGFPKEIYVFGEGGGIKSSRTVDIPIGVFHSSNQIDVKIFYEGGDGEDETDIKSTQNIPSLPRPPPTSNHIRIKIIYSKENQHIHADDPIRVIKKKIIREIGTNNISYDELYLFGNIKEKINPEELYRFFVENVEPDAAGQRRVSGIMLKHIANNLSAVGFTPEGDAGTNADEKETIYQKTDITMDDFVGVLGNATEKYHLRSIPIGQKSKNKIDEYMFISNPYRLTRTDGGNDRSSSSGEIPNVFYLNAKELPVLPKPIETMVSLENELLLNYGGITGIHGKIIYVCLAENIYKSFQPEYYPPLTELYFPFLYKNNIFTYDVLQKQKQQLISKNREIINPKIMTYYKSIDLFYLIHEKRTFELPYDKRGIKEIVFKIKTSAPVASPEGGEEAVGRRRHRKGVPLDVIFKNIHATEQSPFIKFNPSVRQENIYRLYSTKRTNDGKYIPFLRANQVSKLSKLIGKPKQISLFIESSDNAPVYIDFELNGDIRISAELNTPLTVEETAEFLRRTVNPILENIRQFLLKTGYTVPSIDSLYQSNIEIERIKYVAEITVENKLALENYEGVLRSIYDITDNINNIDKSNKDDGILRMRFKRVENFREMNAKTIMITDILKERNNIQDVVDGLMKNYQMSVEEAEETITQYFGEHEELQGRVIDNPGFPVTIRLLKMERKLTVEIDNIISLFYLDTLPIYVDSMLRISQYPKSSGITTKEVKQLSNQITLMRKKITEDELDKPHIQNVVVIAKPAEPTTRIMPIHMRFFGEEKTTARPTVRGTEHEEEEDDDEEDTGSETSEKGFFVEDETKSVTATENIDEQKPEDTESSEEGFFVEEEEEDEEPSPEFLQDDEEGEEEEEGDNPVVKGGTTEPNGDDDEEPEPEPEPLLMNPEGKPLKHPNLFHELLKKRDPALFVSSDKNFDSYSRVCPSNVRRQPVILTKHEFEKINKETRGSYTDYIKYGSSTKNEHYFICPRFWCLKTNTSMTEEDVKNGKCSGRPGIPDKIIPFDAKEVPNDAFVYEFTDAKQHINAKGEYVHHYPGFIKSGETCLPCCFKKPNKNVDKCTATAADIPPEGTEGEPAITAMATTTAAINKRNYIIESNKFPIKIRNRFGFLPLSVESFFQTNHYNYITKNNPAFIQPNKECLLRYSVEQIPNQSILGVFAEIYANEQGLDEAPSVKEFKRILTDAITIDKFVKYNNGYLITVFKPANNATADADASATATATDFTKYENTELFKKINMNNRSAVLFLNDTIRSYENFIEFLLSDTSVIDHTYLFDIITDDNENLTKGGINLVIMEITGNDLTDNISVLCPTNSQTKKIFDPTKRTALVIKNGEYYEPLCLYKEKNGVIQTTKTFSQIITPMRNVKKILSIIEKTTTDRCRPLPGNPKVYRFKKSILLKELFSILKRNNYTIRLQVMNYQGKIIGVVVSPSVEAAINTTGDGDGEQIDYVSYVYLACSPSSLIDEMNDIPTRFVDDDAEETNTEETNTEEGGVNPIWTDYASTIHNLEQIHKHTNGQIPCLPAMKVMEDNLIVGILTETNQFIQIDPPNEDNQMDDLPSINSTNFIVADRELTTEKTEDEEREKTIRKISLETQFYSMFRTTIRQLLNDFKNRDLKSKMVQLYENPNVLYKRKIKAYVDYLRWLANGRIIFAEMDEETIKEITELMTICPPMEKNDDDHPDDPHPHLPKYWLRTEDGTCQLVIPNKHLWSGLNNEKIYYGRLADELLRNNRVRTFMMNSTTYLNITDTEYKINPDEFIVLQSTLQTDYLKGTVAFNTSQYIHNVAFETAVPNVGQKYSNDEITLSQQNAIVSATTTAAATHPHPEEKQTADVLQENTLECIENIRDVIGNQMSLWKRIFSQKTLPPPPTKEIVFKNTNGNCTFTPLIAIFQEQYQKQISVQQLKIFLYETYKTFAEKYGETHILDILKHQGKTKLVENIQTGKTTLENEIMDINYYISNLDIFMFSEINKMEKGKIQLCLFSSTKVIGTVGGLEWVVLGNKYKNKHYFIRTGSFAGNNRPLGSFNLIKPAFYLKDLPEFNTMVQRGVSKQTGEYVENLMDAEYYMENYVFS